MKNLLKDLFILGGLAVVLTGCAGTCSDDAALAFGNTFRFVNYTDGGTTHQDFRLSAPNDPNAVDRSTANIGFADYATQPLSLTTSILQLQASATGLGTNLVTRNFDTNNTFENRYFAITYGEQTDVRFCLVKGGLMTNGNGGMVVANLDRIRGTIDYRIERPTDGFVVHQVNNLTVGGELLNNPEKAQLGLTPGNWRVVATQPGTANVVWTANVTVRANEFTMVLPFDGAGASQNPVAFQIPAFN